MSLRNVSNCVSGKASDSVIAYWEGPDATYVRNGLAERTAVTRSGVDVTQGETPLRAPVRVRRGAGCEEGAVPDPESCQLS